MGRIVKNIVPQRAIKPASISIVPAFPDEAPAGGTPAPAAGGVTARVRDGLVLRQVGKKKSTAKNRSNERPAR